MKELEVDYDQINCSVYDIINSKFCNHICGFTGTPYIVDINNTIYKEEDSQINSIIKYVNNKRKIEIINLILVKDDKIIVDDIFNYNLFKGDNPLIKNYDALIDVDSIFANKSLEEVAIEIKKITTKKYILVINSQDKLMYIDRTVDDKLREYNYTLLLDEIFVYFD